VLFAGNIGKAQGLDKIIDVAERILKLRPEVCFVFLGSGVMTGFLKQTVCEKNISNVIFIPQVPMNEVAAFLHAADVLLVHLRDDPLFRITIPSKTQAYMAIGKPVLMAVQGDAAHIVEVASCGVIAIPEDVDSITQAVLKLVNFSEEEREQLAEAERTFYFNKLSLVLGVGQFAEQFNMLSKKAPLYTSMVL
jgi:colanic acid biosynthesis glycosyl transferase WcaI